VSSKTPYIVGGVVLAAGAYMIYAKRKADAAATATPQAAPQGNAALPAGGFALPTADALASISKLLAPSNTAPTSQRSGLNDSALADGATAASDSAPLYMKIGGVYSLTTAGVAATRKQLANAKKAMASTIGDQHGWFFAPENTGQSYDDFLRESMAAGNSVVMMVEELKGPLESVKQAYRVAMPSSKLADFLSNSDSGVPNSELWAIVA
jgi:hypothetical protein